MSDLNSAVVVTAWQFALLGLLAMALTAALGRSRSAKRMIPAAALVLGGLLFAAAWLPAPILEGPAAPPAGSAPPAAPAPPAGDAVMTPSPASGVDIAGLWDRLRATPSLPDRPTAWLAGLFLIGLGVNVLRLAAGLAGVARLAARAAPIDDAAMTSLLAALRREMGVGRGVRLAESAELTTAALVGGPRPTLLLPAGWGGWSAGERRAVLAHELAHLRRGDFTAGLCARLASLMYFYHPLARRLVRQHRLGQEAAADALAAAHAGGPRRYSASLASLALRLPVHGSPALASPLFSDGKSLIRRIDMLRSNAPDRRRLTAVTLCALAACAAALGLARTGPAAAAEPPRPAGDRLDFRYLPPDAHGVYAIRPALATDNDPRIAKAMRAEIGGLARGNKFFANFPFGEIEQFAGVVTVTDRGSRDRNGHRYSMMNSIRVIRFRRPLKWDRLTAALDEPPKALTEAGVTFHSVKLPTNFFIAANPCFYRPDAKTLVVDSESAIRELIRTGPAAPKWVPSGDLRGDLAVAIRKGLFPKTVFTDPTQKGEPAGLFPLLQKTESLLLVADGGPRTSYAIDIECGRHAAAVGRHAESMAKWFAAESQKFMAPLRPMARDLCKVNVTVEGAHVRATASSKVSARKVFSRLLLAMIAGSGG